MTMQNRCAESQYLRQLVEDKLAENERVRMEDHLEHCQACQEALDTLVDDDETGNRAVAHLRQARPVTDKVLLGAMDRIRSTTWGSESPAPVRLNDFAVDYLHPSEHPNSLGRLGSYDISEVLGSGGMGIVLKGYDAKLHRLVAVKVMAPVLALNPTARKRFLREAQAAAAVRHPNVVTIHSVDEDRLPYLVMEFVDGPSLQQRLDAEGFLQLNQILRIGIQVASGLAAAHAQGLVHRDIKPGNILLESGIERVTITDFGLARAADDASVTREGTVVGTPQYMSPEQARGAPVEQTSDLFSLGSVLYALATGRPPFRAETPYGVMRRITDDSPTAIRDLNPEIPAWLCKIISRLMAKKKDDRFQSAAEVRELLEACLNHTQQPTTALPKIPELPRARHKSLTLKILAGVFTMFTVATGLLFVFGALPFLKPVEKVTPESSAVNAKQEDARGPAKKPQPYERQFVVAFSNPDKVGTLNVDIKRGSIRVAGYEGREVVVQLSVPNYSPPVNPSSKGVKELRPNTLDFEIEKSEDEIKVDGNSYEYITNLNIKVPRATNLKLDSYRDGVIEVRQVESHMNLRSQNNDIRLVDVFGSARLRTYHGDLTASFQAVANDRPLEFESYNGSIDLMLPDDTKANVRYRSGSGRVSTDFEIVLSDDVIQTKGDGNLEFDEFVHGTLNGGGAPIALGTEQGDIRLRRRMKGSIR